MADDSVRQRRSAGRGDDEDPESGLRQPLIDEDMFDTSGKKYEPVRGLSALCCMSMTPGLIFLPLDHRDRFKRAVGAAKGNEDARQHLIRILQSWILVGGLLLGAFIGIMDMVKEAQMNGPNSGGAEQVDILTLCDQLLQAFNAAGAVMCLVGPIASNSVLYLLASSVPADNFDLFAAAARSFFVFSEILTFGMITGFLGSLSLIPFVMFTDRVGLAAVMPPSDFLNSLQYGAAWFLATWMLFFAFIYHVNTVCCVVMHAGLFSNTRQLDTIVWTSDHDTHPEVVDQLVRLALKHKDVDTLMKRLSALRGEDAAETFDSRRATAFA